MPSRCRGAWLTALGAAATFAGAGAAGVERQQSVSLRATLVSASQPHALGVFAGTLSGRTLAWRLSYHGLAAPASSAHLHVTGRTPARVRLCAPCATAASARLRLTAAAASALRTTTASVDLHTARGAIRGPVALGAVPTLQLIGLADGTSLSLPAVVHYAVTGFKIGPGAGRIVGFSGSAQIALQPGPDASSFTLPDDKMLTGRRDLAFVLARSDGALLSNREARVTVFGLVLIGRR